MELGTIDDYMDSIHHPVDLTFAQVRSLSNDLARDRAAFLQTLRDLLVICFATRQWVLAAELVRMIGNAGGFFSSTGQST